MIDLASAKLTFDGHFGYVWSAWFIGLSMLLVLLLVSRIKRKRLLKQIRFDRLVNQQPGRPPKSDEEIM